MIINTVAILVCAVIEQWLNYGDAECRTPPLLLLRVKTIFFNTSGYDTYKIIFEWSSVKCTNDLSPLLQTWPIYVTDEGSWHWTTWKLTQELVHYEKNCIRMIFVPPKLYLWISYLRSTKEWIDLGNPDQIVPVDHICSLDPDFCVSIKEMFYTKIKCIPLNNKYTDI